MTQLTNPPTSLGEPAHLQGPGTWQVSWRGLRTVARLELRQRVRSSRWKLVLAVWALVLGALTALLHLALASGTDGTIDIGPILFSLVVYLVLSLGSLVAPGLSATSINGDRGAGVLATLQTTLLTPAEIVLGKLVAAWLTSLALLAVALPFVAWGFLTGGTPVSRLVVTTALLVVMLLIVCAVGLGWSAMTARTAASVVLTYLTVAFMGALLPVLFALSTPLVTIRETGAFTQRQWVESGTPGRVAEMVEECRQVTGTRDVMHTEWTWWLLAANPYVVLADASPRPAPSTEEDVLAIVRMGVRMARLGPSQDCSPVGERLTQDQAQAQDRRRQDALAPSWPYGLAVNLALGTGFTVTAVRRLRSPARALARGTRVA